MTAGPEGAEPLAASWFLAERVHERILAIAEPHHAEWVVSYLVTGPEAAVLIDTGTGYGDIGAAVAASTGLPVTVVLTHTHWDHIGGTAAFDRVVLFDDPVERARLADGFTSSAIGGLCDPGRFGPPFTPRDFTVPGRADAELVHDGDNLAIGGLRLRVIHTPGHSPGSMSLLMPDLGAVAVGDLVYDGPLYAHLPGADPVAYAASVDRLLGVLAGIDLVLPGHNATHAGPGLVREAARVLHHWQATGQDDVVLGAGRMRLLTHRTGG